MEKVLSKIREVTSDPYAYLAGLKERKKRRLLDASPCTFQKR